MGCKKTWKIRNVEIGAGIPKICVSITGKNEAEILKQAEEIKKNPADIAEWRADFYEKVSEKEKVFLVLKQLREELEDKPILFTFRRKEEGGEKEISPEAYKGLNVSIMESGLADMIDIELFSGEKLVHELVSAAHKRQLRVVLSNHDFEKTPEREELLKRFKKMQQLGADLPKIAVMPQSEKDVLILLRAAEEFNREYADRPFVAISMSKLGLVSRLAGGVFGSAMTFGAVGKVSAPGQIEALELKKILEMTDLS